MSLIRQQNRMSSQQVLEQFNTSTEQIEITADTAELYKDYTCSICITEFVDTDVIRKLQCRHYFHS